MKDNGWTQAPLGTLCRLVDDNAGTDGQESLGIFNTLEVRNAGGKAGSFKALCELGKPAQVLLDKKAGLFTA